MTQVWDMDLPDSQKIVLLALADCANDEGHAWPSIATMARKCSKSERTIQSMIRRLEDQGLVTRSEITGRGNRYRIHPRKVCTPANSAPVQGTTETPANFAPSPATVAPKPSKNHQEPSRGAREARPATPDLDLSSDDWAPPAVADLPDMTRSLVEQWPAGAFEVVCERFRLYWPPAKRTAPRLAKWLLDDHGKVMRDAKSGVSFAALAPAAGGTRKAIMRPYPALRARRHEPPDALGRKSIIRAKVGDYAFNQFIKPAALLPGQDGHRLIVGSEMHRAWIEQNLLSSITAALGVPVRVEVENAAKGVAGE